MSAILVLKERHVISEASFVEMVVWRLPAPLAKSSHDFKYRLALVADGVCVLRYDNEVGKGDHKHYHDEEMVYQFISPQLLLRDFWDEVDKWRS